MLSNEYEDSRYVLGMLNCNAMVKQFGSLGFVDKLVLVFNLGYPDPVGFLSYAVREVPSFPDNVVHVFRDIAEQHMLWLKDFEYTDIEDVMAMGLVDESVTLFRQIFSVRENPENPDMLMYGLEDFSQSEASKEDFWSHKIPYAEAYREFIDASSRINDVFENDGVPVGCVSYVLCANPMVDVDRVADCKRYIGVNRMNKGRFYEGMSEWDSEGYS